MTGSESASLGARLERELVRAALFGDGTQGPQLGRLRIEGSLGAGASALVFAARDLTLDRRVAVKIFARRDTDGRWAAHMQREARALARLSHRHVVSVYDVGEWDGHPFITMELVEGETLARWQADERRTPRDILAAYVQAGRGLEAAHRARLVHRDFKPANVLVASDGRVVVTDFGLAGLVEDAVGAEGPLGTPAYLAPEQATGAPPDPRADVYSFCVALCEALLGRHPLLPPAVRWTQELAGRVPARVIRVLRRGLAGEPSERWPSMTPLLALLDPEHARRQRRRAAAVVGAALVIAAGLVAADAKPETPSTLAAPAAAIAAAMTRLEKAPTAAAAELLRVPPEQRGDEWAAAARSASFAAIPAELTCHWPSPLVAWVVDGELRAGLGEDGRVAVCDPVTGATTSVTGARCLRGLDPTSFVSTAPDGVLEVHERRGGAWHLGARFAEVLDPADAAAVQGCDLRARRAGPASFQVVLGSGRRLYSGSGAPSARRLKLSPEHVLAIVDADERPLARGVKRFLTDPAVRIAIVLSAAELQLFDLERRERVATAPLEGIDPGHLLTAVSSDGRRAVAVARDGPLLWWAEGASSWQTLRTTGGYTSQIALAPGGDRVVLLHFGGGIEVHDRVTGASHPLIGGGGVTSVGFADDDTVVAFYRDGRVARWSLARVRAHIVASHEGRVWTVATSATTVASGGKDGTVRLASLAGGASRVLELGRDVRVYALRFDGDLLLVGCGDGTVQIWSWQEGRRLGTLPGHETWAYDVDLARVGDAPPVIVTGSKGGAVRLWAGGVATLVVAPVDARSEARINDVATSTDGRRAAAVAADGRLLLIDVERRSLVASIAAHRGWARRVAFVASGAEVVTVGDDGWLRCWSSLDGRLLRSVRAHGAPVLDLDVQGGRALTAAEDGSVKLWELASGALVRSFVGHQDAVISVRLRADGRWLVTGDAGGRMGLWRADQDLCQAWLFGHAGAIRSLSFTADQRIVSGGADGTVRLWRPAYDLPPVQLARELATPPLR